MVITIGERLMITWPEGKLRTARKPHRCDYMLAGGKRCEHIIQTKEAYFDPMESNPECAGGLGGFRYCHLHFGDQDL